MKKLKIFLMFCACLSNAWLMQSMEEHNSEQRLEKAKKKEKWEKFSKNYSQKICVSSSIATMHKHKINQKCDGTYQQPRRINS